MAIGTATRDGRRRACDDNAIRTVREAIERGPARKARFRASTDSRVVTLGAILASFALGMAASDAYGRYVRLAECQRWRENVARWAQAVDDASGELTQAETVSLVLAHGAMVAVRDQLCGR